MPGSRSNRKKGRSRYGKQKGKGKQTNLKTKGTPAYKDKQLLQKAQDQVFEETKQSSEVDEMFKDWELDQVTNMIDGEYGKGWGLNKDLVLKSLTDGEVLEDEAYDLFERMVHHRFHTQVNEYFNHNQQVFDLICSNMDEVLKWNIQDLERKPSTLNKDMLGVFATKPFKKGETITLYPAHFSILPKGKETENLLTWEYPRKKTGKLCFCSANNMYDTAYALKVKHEAFHSLGDYAICLKGVGSVYGDPRPEVNMNSNYWGHYINDGAYKGQELSLTEYNDAGNKECNAVWKGMEVEATKDINVGDEIFMEYGWDYWFGGNTLDGRSRHTKLQNGEPFHSTTFEKPKIKKAFNGEMKIVIEDTPVSKQGKYTEVKITPKGDADWSMYHRKGLFDLVMNQVCTTQFASA